jgi:hypothetical protein
MFAYGDGCTMSAKKDGMANIGGFLCTNDDLLAQQEKNLLILTEGYPTYGGLAGRDLEAIAVGLQEALHEDYLRYRIASTAYLGNHISAAGRAHRAAARRPCHLHRRRAFLPHIGPINFPAVALANELYLEGGIRSVEIGTLMFGPQAPKWIWCASPSRAAPTPRATSTMLSKSFLKSGKTATQDPGHEADLRSSIPAPLHREAGKGIFTGRCRTILSRVKISG